jgi:hypothetical protein
MYWNAFSWNQVFTQPNKLSKKSCKLVHDDVGNTASTLSYKFTYQLQLFLDYIVLTDLHPIHSILLNTSPGMVFHFRDAITWPTGLRVYTY